MEAPAPGVMGDPGGKWEPGQAQGPGPSQMGTMGPQRCGWPWVGWELEPGAVGRGGGRALETQHLPSLPPASVQDGGHSGHLGAHSQTGPGLQQEAGNERPGGPMPWDGW